jgi:hypothetical protein
MGHDLKYSGKVLRKTMGQKEGKKQETKNCIESSFMICTHQQVLSVSSKRRVKCVKITLCISNRIKL